MFDKTVLSEQFVIRHKVSDLLKINKEIIKKNILINHVTKKRLHDEEWYSDYNYSQLEHHQHISWIHDYIRDHYRAEYNNTPILVKEAGICLLKNESMGSHHHIDDWDYEGSPEISVIHCLETGEKKSHVIFEYEFGRNKKRRWKELLDNNSLIIFPSYLRHSISKNLNEEALVALSFQFQLL